MAAWSISAGSACSNAQGHGLRAFRARVEPVLGDPTGVFPVDLQVDHDGPGLGCGTDAISSGPTATRTSSGVGSVSPGTGHAGSVVGWIGPARQVDGERVDAGRGRDRRRRPVRAPEQHRSQVALIGRDRHLQRGRIHVQPHGHDVRLQRGRFAGLFDERLRQRAARPSRSYSTASGSASRGQACLNGSSRAHSRRLARTDRDVDHRIAFDRRRGAIDGRTIPCCTMPRGSPRSE